jgi:hypothetical protein
VVGEQFTGNPCADWRCLGDDQKRGERCVNVKECAFPLRGRDQRVSEPGYHKDPLTGVCVFTPLPWQPAGYSKTGVRVTAGPPSNFSRDIVQTSSGAKSVVRVYGSYGLTGRFFVNQTQRVQGRVCSMTQWGKTYFFLVYCNTSWISYVNTKSGVRNRLIGSTKIGYAEGFRYQLVCEKNVANTLSQGLSDFQG